MAHRFQQPPFSEYWSTLRFPSSGWVSEMLTEKLAQSAARDAGTMGLQKERNGNRWIFNCIKTTPEAIEALEVPANFGRSN